ARAATLAAVLRNAVSSRRHVQTESAANEPAQTNVTQLQQQNQQQTQPPPQQQQEQRRVIQQ
ncbi:hypothetical protein DYQ93_22085, partial [Xanthomonas sp. LMG 8992]|nr:hypothetical protein [Xanthomonas sp. LMG 8992]